MTYTEYDKILLFGDSLIQHSWDQSRGFAFAAALQNAYSRRLDVVCRGLSGYNTSQAVHVLASLIPPVSTHSRVKLMVVLFGANDAVLPDVGNPQHTPLEEYKKNLKTILEYPLLREHGTKLVLVAPPPVCEYKSTRRDTGRGRENKQRLASVTKSYADAAKFVANELSVPCVDLWGLFMNHVGWNGESQPLIGDESLPENEKLGELLHDGLHLHPIGYEILFQGLMAALQRSYPDILPDAIPFVFPPYEEAPSA